MKSTFLRVVHKHKSSFFKVGIACALISSHHTSNAQMARHTKISEKPDVVQHLSTSRESMMFQVQLNNAQDDKIQILVRDKQGVLYQGIFEEKNLRRRFQLPKTSDNKVSFVIRNMSTNETEIYEVNTTSKIIEEVIVKRLD